MPLIGSIYDSVIREATERSERSFWKPREAPLNASALLPQSIKNFQKMPVVALSQIVSRTGSITDTSQVTDT